MTIGIGTGYLCPPAWIITEHQAITA